MTQLYNTTAIVVAVLTATALSTGTHGFAPSPLLHGMRSTRTNANPARVTEQRLALVDHAAQSIGDFYQTQPYLAAFLTCSIKGTAADFVAQTRSKTTPIDNENETSFDVPRNLAFVLYGGLIQGLGQEFLFTNIYPLLFGAEATVQTVASQVLTDLALVGPFFCLPTAYTIKASCASDDPFNVAENISAGVEKYLEDVFDRKLLWKYWSIWIPVQSLTFGLVPHHLRVPFVAMFSFFWVMVLSSVSSTAETTVTTTTVTTTTRREAAAESSPSLLVPFTLPAGSTLQPLTTVVPTMTRPKFWPVLQRVTL